GKSPPMATDETRHGRRGFSFKEFVAVKFIDFVLIFVGLYAATALARLQDENRAKDEYVSLLKDFKRELTANLEQEKSIEKDLGPIDDTVPGANLGPIEGVFETYFEELEHDEKIIHCLHLEFASAVDSHHVEEGIEGCHE